MKLTDWQKAVNVVKAQGSITPAKVANSRILGMWIPHSIERRCRELKAKGILKPLDDEKGYRIWVAGHNFKKLTKVVK